MFTVYVLWSETLKKRYVGSTSNLRRRLNEHNSGRSRFTSGGVPWKVLLTERYGTLIEARERESYLKTGAGRAWLDRQFDDS